MGNVVQKLKTASPAHCMGTRTVSSDHKRAGDDISPMPLRVIDVEATINNCEAGGIHFSRSPAWHVISHTWSEDVRKFSEIIGERVLKEAAAKQHGKKIIGYEALFEAAGFTGHPEFLIILREEKVRWVWFDAVCINQTDAEEKDSEIQHMGTYYQSSMGCYVVHHGIGKGFNLLMDDDDDDDDGVQKLPRWFSRAWTFQEWVLPINTTFIIDLDSEETLRKTAATALSREPNCFCCKVISVSILPDFLLECMPKSAKEQSEYMPLPSSWSCFYCRKLFYRRPKELLQNLHHFTKIPGKEHWYFVDDLGYAFLLKVRFQMQTAAQGVFLSGAGYDITQRIAVKQSILRSRTSGAAFDTGMPEVIKEISIRDCSNPEDRVLSVLNLLGVENAVQVRSGKTLEMQLHELSRSLTESSQEKLLLQLCLVEGFGSETPGMSWMPQFQVKKGSWQEDAIAQQGILLPSSVLGISFEYFKAQMTCIGVCRTSDMDGLLHLEGEVCPGKLIFCQHETSIDEYRKENYDEADHYKHLYQGYQLRTMVLEVDGKVVSHLCARITQQDTYVLQALNLPNEHHCDPCIAFPAPRLERIPVWLLKIGYIEAVSWLQRSCFLVCVGEQLGSPLHKIGYLVTQSSADNPFFKTSCPAHCLVGGLGNWPWF